MFRDYSKYRYKQLKKKGIDAKLPDLITALNERDSAGSSTRSGRVPRI